MFALLVAHASPGLGTELTAQQLRQRVEQASDAGADLEKVELSGLELAGAGFAEADIQKVRFDAAHRDVVTGLDRALTLHAARFE